MSERTAPARRVQVVPSEPDPSGIKEAVALEKRLGNIEHGIDSIKESTARIEGAAQLERERVAALESRFDALEDRIDLADQVLKDKQLWETLGRLEKDVVALQQHHRDSATRGSFLRSQWAWLTGGLAAGAGVVGALMQSGLLPG